jgi:hypothetical protein
MLNWVSATNLGSLETGFISELSVVAEQTESTSEIKYKLASGSLPAGLSLNFDGTIFGRVSYGVDGDYVFEITAYDSVNNQDSTQEFTLTIFETTSTTYTDVYFRPYFSLLKRAAYREFLNNEKIFIPSYLYRPHDQNFGIQTNMKMTLDFGVEQLNLEEYVYALRENFYKKRLWLGGVKSAIAKDSAGNAVYEVVYVDVIDDMTTKDGVSADAVVHFPLHDELYYPGSIDNMRKQLKSITLRDWSSISIKNDLQPRFMLTQPPSADRASTYMRVVPICYTLPGKSSIIISNIKKNGFKFNTLDFEIDRLVVSNSLDNNTAKYLIFDRRTAGSLLDLDSYLFGPEGWVRVDRENDEPLQRE